MVWFVGSDMELEGARQLDDATTSASDRAAAIIAGSYLEMRLTDFIKLNVHHKGDVWEKRTHPSAPLGGFAVKIDIAFMFGLISDEAHSDLTRIKDIRNKFAHRLDIQDFDTQQIADSCSNLALFENYVVDDETFKKVSSRKTHSARPGFDRLFTVGYSNMEDFKDPRQRYMWSARVFIMAFGLSWSGKGPHI